MGIARPTAGVAMLAMCVAASVTRTAAATEAPAGVDIAALTGFNSARNHQETSGADAGLADDYSYDLQDEGMHLRRLLHGCHGRKRCVRHLTRCPRCRFPRSSRTRLRRVGHCRAQKQVHNCFPDGSTGGQPRRPSRGREPRRPSGDRRPGPPPSMDEHDVYDYTEEDYTDPGSEMDVPESQISASGYMYEYSYDDEGNLIDEPGPSRSAPGGDPVSTVATAEAFQEALEAGAPHIVLTAHLDMRQSPTVPDLDGVESLNNAIGRVQPTTVSIVGRCDSSAPTSFGLTEPRPSGACAVLVVEDFLDIPLGTGGQGGGLLLEGLYAAVASPAGHGSSTLLLHADGQVWITHSVFQGAGRNCRPIDVSTADGGSPQLYIEGTVFSGFTRNLAPGIWLQRGGTALLDGVTFRDIEVLPKSRGTVIEGTAVAAYPGATLALIGVSFENNVVLGKPAGDQAVAAAKGRQRSKVYAQPQMTVWQWPGGPTTMTEADGATTAFLEGTVVPVAAALRSAQQEQQSAVAASSAG